LNSRHRSLTCIENGRRLACVNGGLQERPGFNGGRLTFKRWRLVLKSRWPMVGAGLLECMAPGGYGSRAATIREPGGYGSRAATIREPGEPGYGSQGQPRRGKMIRFLPDRFVLALDWGGGKCKTTEEDEGVGRRLYAKCQMLSR
jgi:hypothetical protein